MSSSTHTPISIDDLLDAIDAETSSTSSTSSISKEEGKNDYKIEYVEIHEDEIDPRLKLLSHSSRTTLHKCPRKYQLYRLSADQIEGDKEAERSTGVTFAYGSAVGVGIASALEAPSKSEDQIYLDTFLEWDIDLLEENPKQKKSFWLALFAVQKFITLRENGLLADYELVYYEGKPAVELSFQVILPGGFKYRGFVDAVLQHKHTKEVIVLECKTTSGTAQPATYKNSGQAVGYSVVLDKLFKELSSYTVLYLVYEARSMEYKQLPFDKSLLQRALWLQELLIDTHRIELYEEYKTYPMHGEACFDFFRECEYMSLCTLETANFTRPLTTAMLDKIAEEDKKYDFTVDFFDLVESQVSKGSEDPG